MNHHNWMQHHLKMERIANQVIAEKKRIAELKEEADKLNTEAKYLEGKISVNAKVTKIIEKRVSRLLSQLDPTHP